MSELSRRQPNEPARNQPAHDGLSEDYGDLGERRNRRIRAVAWVAIISLILVGGGATVLSLLFG